MQTKWNGKKMRDCPHGISRFYFSAFAGLIDCTNMGDEWYNFGSIENLPTCMNNEYRISNLQMKYAPNTLPELGFESIELKIWDALECVDPEDRFHLNPKRWANVKRDLVEGWYYMPWLYFDESRNRVSLMDGRHRCVSILNHTGVKNISFVYEKQWRSEITNYFL